MYYYSVFKTTCRSFRYYGRIEQNSATGNHFLSKESCEETCAKHCRGTPQLKQSSVKKLLIKMIADTNWLRLRNTVAKFFFRIVCSAYHRNNTTDTASVVPNAVVESAGDFLVTST